MYHQPLSVYRPHGLNWQLPLETVREVPETTEPTEPAGPDEAHSRPPATGDFFEAPDARIHQAMSGEIDRLLNRFPHDDPAWLRERFLALLDQRMHQMGSRLARPEVESALDIELGQAQGEIDALLPSAGSAPAGSAAPLLPQEQLVFDHLRPSFPQADCPDVVLRRVAASLVARGLDSPAAVDHLLAEAWRHDLHLETGTAALGQLGYGGGFQLFNTLLAPTLAPRLLGRGFLPAFRFGYAAGAIVGLCDALATAGLQNVATGMRHAPTAAEVAGQLARTAGISAGTNFLKNYLFRVVLPTLAIHAGWPDGIARATRNQIDFVLDAGGSPLAGAMAAWLRSVVLDDPAAHGRRLLSSNDLEALIDRMREPLTMGDMAKALHLFAEGVGKAALAPSTWAVVLLVVAPMIGLLLAAQNALPQGALMLVQSAVGAAGPAGHLLTGVAAEPPVRATEHAMRAAVSTAMMAVMSGAATLAGGSIGPRVDAAAFRACATAGRRVVNALRQPPGQTPVPGTLRRRSATSA